VKIESHVYLDDLLILVSGEIIKRLNAMVHDQVVRYYGTGGLRQGSCKYLILNLSPNNLEVSGLVQLGCQNKPTKPKRGDSFGLGLLSNIHTYHSK
jgi:hypothetical protein